MTIISQVSPPFNQILQIGDTVNLGVKLTGGTFGIGSAEGAALSASNIGKVGVAGDDGEVKTFDITANQSFIDDAGASQIIGEQFGVTTGVAWANPRPFYIYAVNGDGTDAGLIFAISPNPSAASSPATTNIGYHGNPAATPSDVNFFFLTGVDVTATHDDKPCALVGCLRMTMTTLDDWTIQVISDSDGINPRPYVGTEFTFPKGQMGSRALYNFGDANSPTWATAANITYYYKIGLDGQVYVTMSTEAAGNVTNGTGTTAIDLFLPYAITKSGATSRLVIGTYDASGAANRNGPLLASFVTATKSVELRQALGPANAIDNNDFSVAADDFAAAFYYQAFNKS